jgi:hypothetical protein
MMMVQILLLLYICDRTLSNAKPGPSSITQHNAEDGVPRIPQHGDIKTDYHPGSGQPTMTESFNEYRHRCWQNSQKCSHLHNDEPWLPFRTRADFEFAELALDAALNKEQTDTLIKLFHRCINGQSSFTLENHAELSTIWEQAADKLTPVSFDGFGFLFISGFYLYFISFKSALLQSPTMAMTMTLICIFVPFGTGH